MYTFAHVEIPAQDLKRASAFYAALFQWKFETFYGDDYLLIFTSAKEVIGGLVRVDKVPHAEEYRIYVEVPDIDERLRAAEALGAKVVRERTELPGEFGSYAAIETPDGYWIGLWSKVAE